VHALIATGVNAGGKREILGIDVALSEDDAEWLAFLRGAGRPQPVRRAASNLEAWRQCCAARPRQPRDFGQVPYRGTR
jgi:hypothetical protein